MRRGAAVLASFSVPFHARGARMSPAHLHSAVIGVSVRAVDSGKWQKTLAERYSLDDCTIGSTLHLSLILADHLYEVRAALRRPTRVPPSPRPCALATSVTQRRAHCTPSARTIPRRADP